MQSSFSIQTVFFISEGINNPSILNPLNCRSLTVSVNNISVPFHIYIFPYASDRDTNCYF